MDVPAPKGGRVVKVLVKEGDTVSEGDDIVELAVEGGGDAEPSADQAEEKAEPAPEKAPEPAAEKPAAKASGGGKRSVEIKVPDLGGAESVEIIEVAVAEGDEVEEESTLITLESDKASMDVPSPHAGKLLSLTVKEGDSVSEGDVIGTMEVAGGKPAKSAAAPAAEQKADGRDSAAPGTGEERGARGTERHQIRVPDLSGSSDVPIIVPAEAARQVFD